MNSNPTANKATNDKPDEMLDEIKTELRFRLFNLRLSPAFLASLFKLPLKISHYTSFVNSTIQPA